MLRKLGAEFYRLTVDRPRATIAVMLIVTAFFGWHAASVELNSSVEALLPDGHPAVLQDRVVKEEFDSREMILLGVIHPDGVFNAETLAKIDRLSAEIRTLEVAEPKDGRRLSRAAHRAGAPYDSVVSEIVRSGLTVRDRPAISNLLVELEGIAEADPDLLAAVRRVHHALSPVSEVISLADVDEIVSTNGELRVRELMPDIPTTGVEMDRLASAVYGNPMYVRGLVSPDTTGTAILVELSFHYDRYIDLAHRLFEELERVVGEYEDPEDLRLAGVPMVNVYTSNYMSGDLARLMPVVILVLAGVIFLAFRSVSLTLLPLVIVLGALLWTLGIMSILGRPMTLVVSAMPIMLIAIGVADGIHLLSEYRDQWGALGDRKDAVLTTLDHMATPIVFTSLTDMAGFGSLAVSNLESIRDFGIFTSIGVLAALVFSLTVLPAALVLLPPPPPVEASRRRWPTALARLGSFAVARRRLVLGGAFALVVLGGASLTRLNVGSTMVGYFHEDSEIFQASEMINALFGGTEVLNIVVDSRAEDGLKDPDLLAGIAALQAELESDSIVGYTTSLADYVARVHYVLNDEDPAADRVPEARERILATVYDEVDGIEIEREEEVTIDGRDLIAQYVLLYENAGGDDLEQLADFEYRRANLVAQIRTDHTPSLRRVQEAAQAFAQAQLGPEVEVTFAGCSFLCIVADDLIIPGQLRSLALAIVAVLALLALIFRSLRSAVIGLLPLLLTVLLVFTLMSLFGVYLDAVTALIASIVLGIGIDYSVHFLSRYRSARRHGATVEAAVEHTMTTSGRAIAYNSAAVAIGFVVLLFSSFWPVMHIGWLVAANMVLGAVATLTLLPAALAMIDRGGEP